MPKSDSGTTRTLDEDVDARGYRGSTVPERIGRYRVEAVLGAGGMGTVYAAHDPELDRPVALKILHRDRSGGVRSTDARSRLLREARALARVSHPNVVHVYDAGIVAHGGKEEVFIAMELLAGQSLRKWLADLHASSSWAAGSGTAAVLGVMRQAALGLAAAHDAGLMHRDFKPDNVLVGDKGDVRVVDFGLARSVDAHPPTSAAAASVDLESVDGRLTVTGAVIGTPAYMAPEQFRGAQTDARTDQFSFCATLYEALAGYRPFQSTSGHGLAVAVMEGELRPWPDQPRIPAHLTAAVERGLSVQPSDRFDSMLDLVEALDFDPGARGRRRRRIGALVLGGGASAGAGALLFGAAAPEDVCGGGEHRMAEVWNAQERAELAQAMRSPTLPYAEQSAKATGARLDTYAIAWVAGYRRACEATHVTREQTGTMLDKRMVCLDRGLDRLAAIVSELGVGDAASIEGALQLTSTLPPVERCADLAAITASVEAPPASEAVAVAAARTRLQAAQAKSKLRHYEEAETIVTQLGEQARELDFAPLTVEVAAVRADLEYLTGDTEVAVEDATAALMQAQAIGHDEIGAELANLLTLAVGIGQAQPKQALIWSDLAEATAQRASMTAAQRVEVLRTRAFVLVEYDLSPKALEVALSAHEAALEAFGERDLAVTGTASTVGSVYGRLGRISEAEPYFRSVLEVTEESLGETHPSLISAYQNLGNALSAQGELEEARSMLERAAELAGTLPDIPPRDQAAALSSLGNLLLNEKRFEDAVDVLKRSMLLRRRELGDDHPLVSRALVSLGNAYTNLGRVDDAAQAYDEAIRIRELQGPDHPSLRLPLVNAGMNYVRHGRASDGLAFLQRADGLLSAAEDAPPRQRIECRFWLGRALAEGGPDKGAGLAVVAEALAELEALGPSGLLDDGRAWLARNRAD